jgi:hypothetical protein
MLSRATSWNDFAILCPFNDSIFLEAKVNIELQQYNEYLEGRNQVTLRRLKDDWSHIASLSIT